MKTTLKFLIILLFLLCFSITSHGQLNGEFKELTIPAPSLTNNMFNEPETVDIYVYLPPSYDEVDYAFPVLYFLAGWLKNSY